jgi:hypothetical protein
MGQMKRILLMILILPGMVSAATHYVKIGGSGNGSSWANAWGTISSVNSGIAHGDTVRFGTGNWFGSHIYPIAGATSSAPTVYCCSTYATPGDPDGSDSWHRTQIWSGDVVTGWTQNGNVWHASWTPSTEDRNYDSEFPCIVAHDSIFYMVGSLGAVTRAGYAYNNGTTLYIWPYRSGTPDTVLASARAVVDYLEYNTDYIQFYGLNLKMGIQAAIYFDALSGGSSNNYFYHCTLAHGIHSGSNNSAVIGFLNDDTGTNYYANNVFRACSIYSATAPFGNTNHMGNGATTYNVMHTVFDSCYFYLLPGDGLHFKNCFNNNKFGASRVSFCTFDGTADMPYGGDAFQGGGVEYSCVDWSDSVYGCIMKNFNSLNGGAQTEGGWAIDWSTSSAVKHHYGGDFICNNTFYNCNAFFRWTSDAPSVQDTIKYNIGYGLAYDYSFWDYIGNPDGAGNTISTNKILSDYNYWWDNIPFNSHYSSADHNWTQWRAAGFDTHSDTSWSKIQLNLTDFSRPASDTTEMDQTYGGRRWRKFGAIQDEYAPDVTPPSITNVRDSLVTAASASIFWSTGESTVKDSVLYGTTTACASKQVATNGANHRGDLTGLSPSTKYYFKVLSYDQSDNDSTSALDSLTTEAADVTGPVISGASVSGITTSGATIGWTTDEPATSILEYGLTNSYGSIDSSQTLLTTHTKYLTGLDSSSTYHYRIRSRDSSGNVTQTSDATFNTLAPEPVVDKYMITRRF